MNKDRNYFTLFKKEEVDDQIEPCLDRLLAFLPVSKLLKLKFLVCDQANVTVCVFTLRL